MKPIITTSSLPASNMDVIGTISAVTQVSLAFIKTYTTFYKNFRGDKSEPKLSQELREEVMRIYTELETINEVLESEFAEPFIHSIVFALRGLQKTLQEIDDRLSTYKTLPLKSVEWPFREAENRRLLSQLERSREILMQTVRIASIAMIESKFSDIRYLSVYHVLTVSIPVQTELC